MPNSSTSCPARRWSSTTSSMYPSAPPRRYRNLLTCRIRTVHSLPLVPLAGVERLTSTTPILVSRPFPGVRRLEGFVALHLQVHLTSGLMNGGGTVSGVCGDRWSREAKCKGHGHEDAQACPDLAAEAPGRRGALRSRADQPAALRRPRPRPVLRVPQPPPRG